LERTSIRISKLKIKHLIDSILTLLKNEINANKVNITLEVNDVEITADFDGLSIALRNIVENAIKFSRQLQAPEIKIVLKENVYSWVISVADNGIGFDMKYHNRIFQIFQRLNLPESYKGTGIGLAMVNKSMERMGGKVWAESKPGSGAIFYIKLPKV
jgi:signal transduction histidine kinase